LYSRFFRGPILGPDDVQSEMVKTEPNPATPQILFHHNDAKKSGKQKRKIDVDEEDTMREKCKEERRREKGLRKEAERAARKRKRQDAKDKATDRKDEDIASSKPVDEKVSSSSQEQGPDGETQRVRTKKKEKRLKLAPVDDKLNGHTPISTDKQTLEDHHHGTSMKEGCSKRSRKRRRRD
jgi:hypothetical protein